MIFCAIEKENDTVIFETTDKKEFEDYLKTIPED